ncbi:indolepyruvate ferredoxin oxidoreductase family protein [Oceanicella actignis]|uniref:Indolepyruvate ferredoxin oxidoreductase n=1 Tax=Oceanicella actignis TaxID=1189325 RepID=A0A1M7TXZ7_9RHOB|nr:indolepyruvate ferredoxin oxidoreductase family protein [Oceanicella actignis]SET81032.1 indolepyruvate ferredoxin oxidoreductase [Oceanicella actignis]SHN75557.1 indolepyruvate ferredoxin oxidoreductase [Oceanicella actignis]
MNAPITLDDKYAAESGQVFMSGTQALVRLPIAQMRRDRAAGLNTGAFISGYRGSPLGGYDQQLAKARKHLAPLDIHFQPGVNEELAATAVWGSQQLHLSPGAKKDGVLGIWYGKGPGVDRCGDVFKHANAAGTAPHGGVLCIAGDDHTCKSSTIPHQSDHAFMSALMPMIYPSSVHEFLEYGLLGVAMSRWSGCWVGFKVIADTVETSSIVDLSQERREFVIPEDFEMPPGGLNLRWPDPPLEQDLRLQEYKGYAALAFARANRLDETIIDAPGARLGIVASGKAYEDARQALRELGIGEDEARAIGLRLYKVRMPWPLEPHGIRHFAEGLDEVVILEERREIIENQIKQQLFNWRADVRPRIIGKFDHHDHAILSHSKALTVEDAANVIGARIARLELDEGLKARIAERLSALQARAARARAHEAPVARTPFYCSGCPHNTSTKVPEGSKAMAGIGCHYMVTWMDRNTETFTQMGGEGVPWIGIAPFTEEKHRFVNLGDGTFFHSGHLAIRQAVAAGVNVTYKILYNDAVAMTGGQVVDGPLTPAKVTRLLHDEGVAPIYLVSDAPETYEGASDLAPGVTVLHRDEFDRLQREIREVPGVSAIVYVQTCAAEKRRRRKRGLMEDPKKRVFINPEVCEGCGDCSIQSNCVSIEPLETPMGRKRTINQSTCNKDYSCVKGFCPSFVTLEGAELKKSRGGAGPAEVADLPMPAIRDVDEPWNIAIAGVGGTGVLTIGAILGMAAHLDGKAAMLLDMAGLAQKGGAVLSHVRIGRRAEDVAAPRIVPGAADLMIAADDVVAASAEARGLCDPERTHGVVNTALTPVADFVRNRDFDFKAHAVLASLRKTLTPDSAFLDFRAAAEATAGDAIAANVMMLGHAWQSGWAPISLDAIMAAIELNGVAVEANKAAFDWGRLLAARPEKMKELLRPEDAPPALEDMTLAQIVAHREAHLTAYQGKRLARRWRALVERVRAAEQALGMDPDAPGSLTRAAAVSYAKVLAYKDEYEVARLLSDQGWIAGLKARFDGEVTLSYNLAPPFLGGTDANGRPKKRVFGPWLRPLLKLLRHGKALRGTPLDPFGRSEERRAERRLIARFEEDVETALGALRPETAETARALLALPQQIRGFGPVKAEAMRKAEAARARLLEALRSPAAPGPEAAPDQSRIAAQ